MINDKVSENITQYKLFYLLKKKSKYDLRRSEGKNTESELVPHRNKIIL